MSYNDQPVARLSNEASDESGEITEINDLTAVSAHSINCHLRSNDPVEVENSSEENPAKQTFHSIALHTHL